MRGPLYLVRHGEAEGNSEHRYIGWSDPALTPRGEAQAAEVAELLRDEPIRRVLSSDRQRAIATARPIAAAHGLPLSVSSALRELNFGRWDGRTPDELWATERNTYDAWLHDPEGQAPPDGESLSTLRARLVGLLSGVQEGDVWVTHGGPIRLILASEGAPFWSQPVAPGSVWRIELGRAIFLGPIRTTS